LSVGIHPQMFKTLVGNGHREFSTKQQQDAHEFLLHLLTLVDVSVMQGSADCWFYFGLYICGE